MKHLLFAATLAVSLALPALAQTSIPAPGGWTSQTKAGGAQTFVPSDLRAGEVFSVTIYDATPLKGKSLGAFLREFAGTVGTKPGQLRAPFSMDTHNARYASGTGIYRRPDGTQLTGAFSAFSFDGGRKVSALRVLTSADAVFLRYETPFQTLVNAFVERARTASNEALVDKEPDAATPEAAAKSNVQRYPFATAPGKGVSLSQIALVLHYGAMAVFIGGTQMVNEDFLMLKDGTIHRGLPVPPDELDVVKSRRGEPENWGKWRRKGADFEVSWAGQKWEELEGTRVEPGTPQTRLDGRYGGASASSGLGTGSYAYYGVAFDKNGRFQTDRSGGGYSQGLQDGGSASYSVGSDGAVVLGADGVVVSKGQANPRADREGTYTINGYTLTLRYDNGRVVRQPFFILGSKREGVLFKDEVLLRDENTK